MEQQADFSACGAQVIEKLLRVGVGRGLRSLYFEYDAPVHEKVGFEVPDLLSLEKDVDGYLPLEWYPQVVEYLRHRVLVDRLEEAESQSIVDPIECADDPIRQFTAKKLSVDSGFVPVRQRFAGHSRQYADSFSVRYRIAPTNIKSVC